MFKEKLLGNTANGNIQMVYQHQHDSLISIMTKPYDYNLEGVKSKYQWDFNHFAKSIFSKDVLNKIGETEPDYLVFDTYAEAVCPVVKINDESYVTVNYYIQDSTAFEDFSKYELIWPSNSERKKLFEQYAPSFFGMIREKFPKMKIILVRARASCELYDINSKVLKNFEYADRVEQTNKRRLEYDELVMNYVPDIKVLNMLDEYNVADTKLYEDYKYEVSHNHYSLDYYKRQYAKLQNIIIEDLVGEKGKTKYFNQAVCILAGEDYSMLKFLTRIYKDFFRVFIQIDQASINKNYTTEEIAELRAIPNVFVMTKIRSPKGSMNELEAIVELTETAFAEENVKYVHFVTGNDVPVRPIKQIYEFFEENDGKSFLNLHADGNQEEMKKVAEYSYRQYYYLYNCDEKDPVVKGMTEDSLSKQKKEGIYRKKIGEFEKTYKGVFGGSLSREAYEYCKKYVSAHPEYVEDIKYSRLRLEFYFHTILFNDTNMKDKLLGGIRGGKHDWIWDDNKKDYAEISIDDYKKLVSQEETFFIRNVSSDNEEVLGEIYKDISTPYRVE